MDLLAPCPSLVALQMPQAATSISVPIISVITPPSASSPPTPVIQPDDTLLPPCASSLRHSSPPALFQLPPTTHANRNTSEFVQETRKLAKTSDAQKASLKIRQDADEAEHKAMNTELTILLTKQRTELIDLAGRYSKKIDYIDKLVSTSAHYKHKRNVNIENAKLHAKAAEVNAGILFFNLLFFLCSHAFSPRTFCW